MKSIISILFLVFTSLSASAQLKFSLEYTSTDVDFGHQSANTFAKQVGDSLQAHYPSMVKNPRVSLTPRNVFIVSEGRSIRVYTFQWECDIIPCDSAKADLHFDRRGTIYGSSDSAKARAAVLKDIKDSDKVAEMWRKFDSKYGSHSMPYKFVQKTWFYDTETKQYWYLEEYFCTSKTG